MTADRKRYPRVFAAVALLLSAAVIELISYGFIAASSLLSSEPIRTRHAILAEQSRRIARILSETPAGRREIHDAELGWRYRPGFRSSKDAINDQGLRGLRSYSDLPGAGVVRTAVFGDSFVYCSEVAHNESWPLRLEELDPRMEVLNYGVGGYGIDQALLRLRREGEALSPQIVIMGFAPIDLRRNVNVYRRFLNDTGSVASKPRFRLGADGQLELLANPIRHIEGWRRYLEQPEQIMELGVHDYWYRPSVYENPLYDLSATVRTMTKVWNRIADRYLRRDRLEAGGLFRTESEAFRILIAELLEFDREVRQAGAQPIVLMLPGRDSVDRDRRGDSRVYDPIIAELKAANVHVIDAAKAYHGEAGEPSDGLFMSSGHYSPLANRQLAAWLLPHLLASNVRVAETAAKQSSTPTRSASDLAQRR